MTRHDTQQQTKGGDDQPSRRLPGLGTIAVVGGGAALAALAVRHLRRRNAPRTAVPDPIATTGALQLGSLGVEMAVHWFEDAATRRNAPAPTRAAEVDLEDFAQVVLTIAASIEPDPTPSGLARGRFGDRKVFLSAIRRALADTAYGSLPRAEFDALLLDAHRRGLLDLARADLVSVMDPAEVAASEVRQPLVGSSFHFVVAERNAAGTARTSVPLVIRPARSRHLTEIAIRDGFRALLYWSGADPSVASEGDAWGYVERPDGSRVGRREFRTADEATAYLVELLEREHASSAPAREGRHG